MNFTSHPRHHGFRKRAVRSEFHKGQDEIEFMREGGLASPDRDDLERLPESGAFRTYGGADEQDGDGDFDSAYGDDQKLFNDPRAEEQFMRGQDDHESNRPHEHFVEPVGKLAVKSSMALPPKRRPPAKSRKRLPH